jgi:hypothetical protein
VTAFLGVRFGAGERVASVRIASGEPSFTDANFVVMDDFIYGEPQTVPEPVTFSLLAGRPCSRTLDLSEALALSAARISAESGLPHGRQHHAGQRQRL